MAHKRFRMLWRWLKERVLRRPVYAHWIETGSDFVRTMKYKKTDTGYRLVETKIEMKDKR